MSIPIRCEPCAADFKAPDRLAGKKVKCPRCAQIIRVPAGAEAITVPVQSRKRENGDVALAARSQKATRPIRLPLLSFEHLKVPGRLRRSIEDEVGDEKTIWLGRPSPQSLFRKAIIGMVVGLVIVILTVVGVLIGKEQVVGLENIDPSIAVLIVWGVGGLILLSMGLPMLTMPIWVRWLINYRDCYVLTPTRAIVFDNEKIFSAKAKSFTADRLAQRSLHVKEDGSGSIFFGSEVVDLGLRERRRTKDREGPGGEKVRVTTTTTWREKANKSVGFLDIEEVEKVEALLRQVLNLGPPASKEMD
jgi:hypothetical protein